MFAQSASNSPEPLSIIKKSEINKQSIVKNIDRIRQNNLISMKDLYNTKIRKLIKESKRT